MSRVVYNLKENDPWKGKDFVSTFDEDIKKWRVCFVIGTEERNCMNGATVRYELRGEDYVFDTKDEADELAHQCQRDYNEDMTDLVGGMN